jgi:hypothetical protein
MPSPPYKISYKSPIGSTVTKVFLYTYHRYLNIHHFRMAEAMGLKKCGVKVTFNGITCIQNFMRIHQSVKKLFVEDTQTE